jgi:putative nucleotidyltransferase-like protein
VSEKVVWPTTELRPEVDLLFASASAHISPEMADRMRAAVRKDVDWIQLIRLVLRHGTMPLLYRNIKAVCPDAVGNGILDPLRARYEAEAADNRRRAEELVAQLRVLQDAGIRAIPYKGPTLAQQLYGDLSLRGFGDLDILVPERDVLKAQGLIRRCGYEFTWAIGEDRLERHIRENHELQLCRADQDLRLDLHWRFVSRSTCLSDDPERFLRRVEMISLLGNQVPTLPLEVYLLVLSLHAAKHKWGQLKLICDIAEIFGHPELDWKYTLNEAADLGLKRVLAVSALMAQDTLGAKMPPGLARGLKIDRAAHALAAQARESLLREPDETWGQEAHYSFQYEVRERLRDRANIHFQHEVLPKLTPDERDRMFLHLPDWLSTMYYLVRPVRMAWEKMADRS